VSIDIILVLYAKRRVASTAHIVKSIARFIRLRRIIIVVNGMEINLAEVEPLFSNYCEAQSRMTTQVWSLVHIRRESILPITSTTIVRSASL
jgi:hypothetical protein